MTLYQQAVHLYVQNAYFALQNACWKAQTLSVLYRSGAGLVTESLKVTKFQQ